MDIALVTFTNMVMLFGVWFYLKIFFFSFIVNLYKDEGSNDTDHTISTLLVESEKEISGIDDLMIVMLVVFFVFGVYFLFYCLALVTSYTNNFVCIYILFPLVFFFI
jgi:hypothetical protein